MKNKQHIPVCCAVVVNANRVLAVQRSADMPLPGKWEFPGGKLEPGESEEACIIRELQEELQIRIQPGQRLTPSRWETASQIIELIPYLCHSFSGEIHLQEHKKLSWLEVSELNALDWAEADIPIVREVQQLLG